MTILTTHVLVFTDGMAGLFVVTRCIVPRENTRLSRETLSGSPGRFVTSTTRPSPLKTPLATTTVLSMVRVPDSWLAGAGKAGVNRYLALMLEFMSRRVLGQFDPQLLGREPVQQALNLVEPNGESGTRRLAGFVAAALPGGQHEAAEGVKETYEFRIDDDTFHVRVNDGEVSVREGAVPDPDLVITSDFTTFLAIGKGETTGTDAVARGEVHVEGDPAAAQRCEAILAGNR